MHTTTHLPMFLIAGCFGLILCARSARAQDVVHLKDGRKIEGTVLSEDDKEVKLKVRFGSITFTQAEILKIVRAGQAPAGKATDGAAPPATPSQTAGGRRSDQIRNGFFNYAISKPGRPWIFKQAPPEPLTDLLIYHPKLDADVSILVLPDRSPNLALTPANLKFFLRAIERKLQEKYTNIRKISSGATRFQGRAAHRASYDLVSKLSKLAYNYQYLVFQYKSRLYTITRAAPQDKVEQVRKDFAAIIKTFTFIEAKELEGGRYSNFQLLYGADKPAAWNLDRTKDGSIFRASDGHAAFVVTVRSLYDRKTLTQLADQRKHELAGLRKDFRLISNRSINLLRTVVQELKYSDSDAGKTRQTREIIVLSDTKLYFVQSRVHANAAAQHAGTLRGILASFTVQRDLTSRASIEEGFKAIELFDEGDKAAIARDYGRAATAYEKAIGRFPNFAVALNNLAINYRRQGASARSLRTQRKAFKLYPENLIIRKNMASALTNLGIEKINRGKYQEAIVEFEKARKLDPKEPCLRKNLAIAYQNQAIDRMNQGNYMGGIAILNKAIKLDPTNPLYKKNIAVCHYNMAVGYANRRQNAKAVSACRAALKSDPANGHARNLLNQLRQRGAR